jgi:phosphoribosyl-ATP pyrophosphohydrolase/phosphoribosyl-AMP cyclohydrolase
MKIYSDCDNDALVFKVKQTGAACHTGNKSCFFNEIEVGESDSEHRIAGDNLSYGNYSGIYGRNEDFKKDDSLLFLNDLYAIIADRISEKSENSYTYKLHQKGIEEIVKKIGEESTEIILAAIAQEKGQIVYEIADLFYHILVLMFEKEVSLKEIIDELKSRHK